jgi:glycogen operon protein
VTDVADVIEEASAAPMVDDDFLVLANAWWEPITFIVPEAQPDQEWRTEIDSFDPSVPAEEERPRHAGDRVTVRPRSLTVPRSPRPVFQTDAWLSPAALSG